MARKIPGLGGLGALGNLGNIPSMLKEAQKAGEQMQELEEELTELTISAAAGGGMVKASVTGAGQFIGIRIDPKVVDPKDVEMLEDLIVSAVKEAQSQANQLREKRTQEITGNLKLPKIPGMPF